MLRNVIASTLGEGDYLPSGEHAINLPFVGLQTHLGVIPFPPGETQGVLFPVISNAGGIFGIAGNCQSSARPIVVWYDGAWHDDYRSAVGNKSCIFDNFGVLTVNQGEAGSQGYRYVTSSNQLVKCDDTHGPTYHVSKWTDLSVNQDRTLLVGQAHWTNAVVVWDGALVDGVMTGVHRVIEAVAGNWITAHRLGDLCSITYATATYAALVLASEAELRGLPIIEVPVEPPPIDETTPPEPEPPEPPITEPPEPEPIPPQPQPEPEPEVPTMLFIETKYEKTNPTLAVMKFDIIANGDGTESYRSVVRAASTDAAISGTPIYCVTPDGKDEWRADPGGPWESFRRTGNVLVADRPPEDSYTRFCVEVK
jgi:hypothetical protein